LDINLAGAGPSGLVTARGEGYRRHAEGVKMGSGPQKGVIYAEIPA